jgi:hypothetical protein
MNTNWTLLTGAALGAGTMFLLDPDRGTRRRALIRDRAMRVAHETNDGLGALSRDVANRTRGVAAEVRGRMREGEVGGRKLVERVRAELGRVVSHPRALDVVADDDGRVTLVGPILASEADVARAATSSVRGVTEVIDQLERHESAEGVPSLQGGRVRPGQRSALLQGSWSPATKLVMCLASTAVAAGAGYAAMTRYSLSPTASSRSRSHE